MSEDRNCLSFWYPRLLAAGLPVPRTEIVDAGMDWRDLTNLLDGKPVGHANVLATNIRFAVERLGGYPAFLRTGQGSGKHDWNRTCFLTDTSNIVLHIAALVEWSECVDMLGLSYRYWCVREWLPTRPQAVCPRYAGMPVNREFRFFAASGESEGVVKCYHSYWPREALQQGGCVLDDVTYAALCYLPAVDSSLLHYLARFAAQVLGGAWSIDFLETRRGWMLTDCAEAARSFHWPDCPAIGK